MEISDELRYPFSDKIEANNGAYTLTVPIKEIVNGDIQPDAAYRVAILKHPSPAESIEGETAQESVSTTIHDEENSQ